MLISRAVASRVPPTLAVNYIVGKIVKLQAFWRMKMAKLMLKLIKKSDKVLLVAGPARLTRGSRVKGGFIDETKFACWLKTSPPSLNFIVTRFSRETKKRWQASINLSELSLVKTRCRTTLQRLEVSTARQYLQSLVLSEGQLYFEMNKKVDILFNTFLAEDVFNALDVSLDEEDMKQHPKFSTSSASRSKSSKSKQKDSNYHIRKFESRIMKKVITIQRFVRGFITRLYYRRLVRVSSIVKLTREFIQEGEVRPSSL